MFTEKLSKKSNFSDFSSVIGVPLLQIQSIPFNPINSLKENLTLFIEDEENIEKNKEEKNHGNNLKKNVYFAIPKKHKKY